MITPDFQRKVKRALTRSIANSNLVPVLQRELTQASAVKAQREKPRTRRQLKDTGVLVARDAKRQIADREARERLADFRRERRKADKLAAQQREEQEILEKRRSGEIAPPDNPVDQLFWFDTVGDPFM